MNYYLLLKAVHLPAVVAFLGNSTTGLFWMRFARKTNDVKIIHHTVKGVIASDRLFTIPGVIIITAGGILTASYGGLALLGTGWILAYSFVFALRLIFWV